MPLRLRLRKLWWNFLCRRKFVRKIVSEELTDALHPEFGWAWAEDGDFARVLKERDNRIEYLSRRLQVAESGRRYWQAIVTDQNAVSVNPPYIFDPATLKKSFEK